MNTQNLKIAVVMTCFNRKDKTAACIRALQVAKAKLDEKTLLHIIVTEDGCTDGTSEMLARDFPEVEVLHGDGSLFWNGGMRLAFGHALDKGYDFYLWVNDDTTLYPDCLTGLLETHHQLQSESGMGGIVVGSTHNHLGKVSYGGLKRQNERKPLKFRLIEPEMKPVLCDSANGNCLLIAASAAKVLGNLDVNFAHCMGDMDYVLRARRHQIPAWVMPGFVGVCDNDHPKTGSYLDETLPFKIRWKKALSPKELNPRSWATFCSRHAGIFWPLYWVWPYIKVVLTSLRYQIKKLLIN